MRLDYPEVTNWIFVNKQFNTMYSAPEDVSICLWGQVWGSDRFEDDHRIATSKVLGVVYEQGWILIKTRNSIYKIRKDTINPEYKQAEPDIWTGLLKAAGEI